MPPKRGTPKKCATQEAVTAARQAQVGDLGHTSDSGSALSRCTTRSSSNHSTTVWCTPTPERSSEHHQADEARLRAGLAPLPMSSLLQQTVAHGVEPSEVAVAVDGGNPKACLIELIVGAVLSARNAADSVRAQESATLATAGLSDLLHRAAEAGHAQAAINGAVDTDDPKAALTELIVSAAVSPRVVTQAPFTPTSKPHFGGSTVEAKPSLPAEQSRSAKHVMLSYQWDHQKQVKAVNETLMKLGLNVWMDINGGMGTDIYESMAAGVSNASVVVCFMSQKYQESANCKLELKFAQQSGVEIVPVMMECDGWKASGWLGLVTAGSLWTPLHDAADFKENVRLLYGQLVKVIGTGDGDAHHTGADDDDRLSSELIPSHDEAKEELERLRESQAASQSTVSVVLADPSAPATIPAGVPKLPARFHATSEIQTLTRLVLSTSRADMAKSRVGFFGMGGIGKTVTGAAIVRNDAVRLHFHAVVWLPIGQTPVVAKLLNLCHMQCTGKELSAELSAEEKKQALQQAMKGKKVLLCLDDLWEEVHETELNFADVTAGSKVLISTRNKELLAGAHQVEVGLPSASDSARMLLSAADVEDVNARAPTGVAEIVSLCGRLPLALGIAGRLAASLGLVGMQDWSGMIGVLKEELRESHSEGAEEGMIRASLRGLKGSAAEQENVKALLNLFALVREDTHCPLEVLLLMFNATVVGSSDSTVTIMHIRKWLRILIDRSLVLGTIDRPSVHDLVLDFAVAQHSEVELRAKHCAVVGAFREARPTDVHGRALFASIMADDAMCAYVCAEVSYHLDKGWCDDVGMTWLSDVPQDAIVIAAGHVMGLEQLREAAFKADSDVDSWLAGRLWALTSIVTKDLMGQIAIREPVEKCLDAIASRLANELAQQLPCQQLIDDLYEVQLDQMMAFGALLDGSGMEARSTEINALLKSTAAHRNPVVAANLHFHNVIHPVLSSGNWERIEDLGIEVEQMWKMFRAAMDNHRDLSVRSLCSMHAFNTTIFVDLVILKAHSEIDQHYGPHAGRFMQSVRAYDYDQGHVSLSEGFNADYFMMCPCALLPVALHYGHIAACREYTNRSIEVWQRAIGESNRQIDHHGFLTGLAGWGFLTTVLSGGLVTVDQQTAIVDIFESLNLTWKTVAEHIEDYPVVLARKKGSKELGAHLLCHEGYEWSVACAYLLMTRGEGVEKEDVLQFLPRVETIIERACTHSDGAFGHGAVAPFLNSFVLLAMVCEQFELWEHALLYCEATLETDFKKAGCRTPVTRTAALLIQGRTLAALGRVVEAAEVLEAASCEAQHYELWMVQVIALRDLKLCVLDTTMPHADHASRRLGEALRKLTAPAELLSPMLRGLDAAKLMSLGAPEAGYEVAYTVEDVATAALRRELEGMRFCDLRNRAKQDNAEGTALKLLRELQELSLKGLRQRAMQAGIEPSRLEDAMDADEPEAVLVAYLVEELDRTHLLSLS
jgi:hypothetical protein